MLKRKHFFVESFPFRTIHAKSSISGFEKLSRKLKR